MAPSTTKQAFLNIYERVLKRVLRKERLDRKTEYEVRKLVAHLVLVAWNRSNDSRTLSEAKKDVIAYANQNYGGKEKVITPLLNAVSIKWHDYGDDHTFIPGASVGIVEGEIIVDPKLENEIPYDPSNPDAFRAFMESPEIRERLSHVPAERLNEEITKIVAEYNARKQNGEGNTDGGKQ